MAGGGCETGCFLPSLKRMMQKAGQKIFFEIIAINGIKDIKRLRNPSCSVKLIYSKRNMNPLHSR